MIKLTKEEAIRLDELTAREAKLNPIERDEMLKLQERADEVGKEE